MEKIDQTLKQFRKYFRGVKNIIDSAKECWNAIL